MPNAAALRFLTGLRFDADGVRRAPGTDGTWAGVRVVDLGAERGYEVGGIPISMREALRTLDEIDRRTEADR
jgi:hypothetical protein